MHLGPLRKRLAGASRWLFDTVLPPVCPGCGEELAGRRWLCGRCRRALRPVGGRRVCLACRGEEPGGRESGFACDRAGHLRAAAAFWMEPPLDAVVHDFKYRGRDDLGRPLGRLLARKTRRPRGDLLAPMPLHRTRLRERGYNQAALLAQELSRVWGIPPVPGILARRRGTRAQARLAREDRAGNVEGAFWVPEPGWVRGRHLILVDDVITSGSTALAAVEALRDAGAVRIAVRCLALA